MMIEMYSDRIEIFRWKLVVGDDVKSRFMTPDLHARDIT